MRRPSVSVVLTVHERPRGVIKSVIRAIDGYDQLVIVSDRATSAACDGILDGLGREPHLKAIEEGRQKIVNIDGPPGWRCPSAAWNAGFKAATGDILYCLSSDVVQQPGNIDKARRFLSEIDAVLFGYCVESDPERAANDPTTTPILCSADAPRPLGFIMAFPRWALEEIGGYDEAFMEGQWQEDKDFIWRLWDLGLHFAFWDEISGVHQSHDRSFLDSALIEKNRQVFISKWGSIDRDLEGEGRTIRPEKDLTIWVNPRHAQRARRREVA